MGSKRRLRARMLAKLGSTQHGVVAVWQLLELGFSRREIAVRVESRRFHRVYRGVYAVGHPARTAEALEMAAVLACGPQAVLSHWRAAGRCAAIRTAPGPAPVSAHSHREP